MKYDARMIRKAIFKERPNRFITVAELDGREIICHMNNTGRCRELLESGREIFVLMSDNDKRKTACDLVAVSTPEGVVNIDSLAPNRLFGEWLESGSFKEGISLIKPECVYRGGNSRFDYYIEYGKSPVRKMFIEVKGVTLRGDPDFGVDCDVAMFPDAPTERGLKHLRELIACKNAGFDAAVCFMITMPGISSFRPARHIHPEFAEALCVAKQAGVEIHAFICGMSADGVSVEVIGEVQT